MRCRARVGKRRPDAMAPLAERALPRGAEAARGEPQRAARAPGRGARRAAAVHRRRRARAAHAARGAAAAGRASRERAGDDPARAAAHGDLEAGVARASQLVDQLLTLARLEPEALAAQFRATCDLVALAKDAIVARAPLAARQAHRPRPRTRRGRPRARRSREPRDPAREPARQRAALHARGRTHRRRGRRRRGPGVLTVADTGPGIPPHERERVFDRFYRGRDRRRGAAGSGLGLSIVKRIADAHGATIDARAPARTAAGLVVARALSGRRHGLPHA